MVVKFRNLIRSDPKYCIKGGFVRLSPPPGSQLRVEERKEQLLEEEEVDEGSSLGSMRVRVWRLRASRFTGFPEMHLVCRRVVSENFGRQY